MKSVNKILKCNNVSTKILMSAYYTFGYDLHQTVWDIFLTNRQLDIRNIITHMIHNK